MNVCCNPLFFLQNTQAQMFANASRFVDEHRYSREELTLSLQRNPKQAQEATAIVISALKTVKNSAVFWQYAIRRLRTACVVIQRLVRRLVIGARLSVQQVVERWLKNDVEAVQLLEAAQSAEGFGPESPFLFFNIETRQKVVRDLFVQQRAAFRQKYRLWLHELRNLELEMEMLKDDLALQKRRMAPSFSGSATSMVLADGLRRQRRSLFAGTLGVGPNATQIISSLTGEGSRSHSIAAVSPNSSPLTPRRSLSKSPSDVLPSQSTPPPMFKSSPNSKKAAAKAVLALRAIEERITSVYNTIYRHKLHIPRFEFSVDFKTLHDRAMKLYADEAKFKVTDTMKGLGVSSKDLWTAAVLERIKASHDAILASAPALIAQRAFSSVGDGAHAASFRLNRLGGLHNSSNSPRITQPPKLNLLSTPAKTGTATDAALETLAENIKSVRATSTTPRRGSIPHHDISALTSVRKNQNSKRASSAALSQMAVALQKTFSKQVAMTTPRPPSGVFRSPREHIASSSMDEDVGANEEGQTIFEADGNQTENVEENQEPASDKDNLKVSAFATPVPPQRMLHCGSTIIRLASQPTTGKTSNAFLTETETQFETVLPIDLPNSISELEEKGYSYLSKLGITDPALLHFNPSQRLSKRAMDTNNRHLLQDTYEIDIATDFEIEMETLKRNGVIGGSAKWTTSRPGAIPKGKDGRPLTAHVNKLSSHLQSTFNGRVSNVAARPVSPGIFQSQFIPPTHTLYSIVDEELLMQLEQEHLQRTSEAKLLEDKGPFANRAVAMRVQSARARINAAKERDTREHSSDYVIAQDPKSKFKVPPRHNRFTSNDLEQLNGVYPYHRFYNVYHPTSEEKVSAQHGQTIVSALFGGSAERKKQEVAEEHPNGPPISPRLVTFDPTGKVVIQKHLLKHSYPHAFAAHQAQRQHQMEEQREKNEEAVTFFNSRRAHRHQKSTHPTDKAPDPIVSQAPLPIESKVPYVPPALTPAFMDKLMDTHQFSAATQLVVRGIAEDWQRNGDYSLTRPTLESPNAKESGLFTGIDSQSPIAPFRRAPSSNALREPLKVVTSIRNHSCGITAMLVIDYVSEETAIIEPSKAIDAVALVASSLRNVPNISANTLHSRHLVATGAFDGVVRIVTFPDLKEVCHRQGKGSVTEMKLTKDKGTLCVAHDEGSVRLFKRKQPKSWDGSWEVHATLVIGRPALHALSMSLYGDSYLILGCHAGRFYIVPTDFSQIDRRLSGTEKRSTLASPTESRRKSVIHSPRIPMSPSFVSEGVHHPRPPTRTASMDGLLSPTTTVDGAQSTGTAARVRARRGSTAAALVGLTLSVESVSIVQLETNVLGVNKLLSYNNEMIITGGLDAQCNVIRMVYGSNNVAAMKLRVAQSDAALSENIAEMLGLQGVKSPRPTSDSSALNPVTSSGFLSPLSSQHGAAVDSPLQRQLGASPTSVPWQHESAASFASPMSLNSVYGNAMVPPASSPAFTVSMANMPFATSQGHGNTRADLPKDGGAPEVEEPPFAVETARPFTCHSAAIVDLAHIGPQGDLVCSASLDKTICVWDSLSFDLRYTFKLSSILKSPMVVAPHGVVICPLENARIIALSVTSGSVLSETSTHTLKDPCISGCLVQPNSSVAAFGTYGGRLIFFNPLKGSIDVSRCVHTGAVTCLAACGDSFGNRFFVSCSDDRVTNFTAFTGNVPILSDDV